MHLWYIVPFFCLDIINGLRAYTKNEMLQFKEEVRQMFQHAYDGYLKYAYPYDELRPLSCDGIDTWGSYSLTLIDALDTLAIMGNYSEFRRVVEVITTKANFDANINVSVFETNIRIVGGLLSAHLLSHRAGLELEPGWPCNGPLLRLAEDVAKRLIAAFDTKLGMPYGTVNLRHGIPVGETPISCTAGIGTYILEFGTLSRLTGDPMYEEVAMNALYALYNHRSHLGLYGNHIDVLTGHWTAQDAGIGAGVDSFFEYLVKGSILLQKPELMEIFHEAKKSITKHLKREDWYLWATMSKGQITLPVFQSLEAYWPGVLSLIGDTASAMRTLHNYHQVWLQYGFTPEFFNIPQTEAGANRESYPLRPELIESVMYLYRATGDPFLLEVGVDILRSLQYSAKTPCGYATIKDVRDHRKEDRMESFFLAETTKYLYLLFDTENFIHNQGQHGVIIDTPNGECIIEAGGYIFNTEAHPIDPSALYCCYDKRYEQYYDFSEVDTKKNIFRGNTVEELKYNFADEMDKAPIDEELEIKNKSTNESEVVEAQVEITSAEHKGTVITGKATVEVLDEDDHVEKVSIKSANTEDVYEIKVQLNDVANESGEPIILFSEDGPGNIIINQAVINTTIPPQKHDPQMMLERIRQDQIYPKNWYWENNYKVLSCKAQPFLQRISILGEFFKN